MTHITDEDIQHNEGQFTGCDNLQLYYQAWRPAGSTRAALAIVHGLGEHSGRYQGLTQALAAQGIAVYALDQRGFGRSEGQRGYINHWDEFMHDLGAFIDLVQEAEADLPIFLLGHSLGGVIAFDYADRRPQGLRGMIASAPALIQTAISPVKVVIAKLLSRYLPRFTMASGLNLDQISRDQELVRQTKADPLSHQVGTPRIATEAFAAQDRVLENAHRFPLPLLLIHGDEDGLIPLVSSQTFYERMAGADKQLIVYPGGYHESHNDLHRQQVYADLAGWILERVDH
jgi:alpha-beta hydrolase superfamily lysophospholipase